MLVRVYNHWTDVSRDFRGEPRQVLVDLQKRYPWIERDNLNAFLDALDANQAYSVEVLEDVKKGEPDIIGQLGLEAQLDEHLQAARWLSGNQDAINLRPFLKREEDLGKVVSRAYDLQVGETNVVKVLKKAEEPQAVHAPTVIKAGAPGGEAVAQGLRRAFARARVQNVFMGGKHSRGSMLARDPENGHAWLLKPGSGGQSPAAGLKEEVASQARREAGFYHVAFLLGLGHDLPVATLVIMDGHDWAAMDLLDHQWQNLNKLYKQKPTQVQAILEHLRSRGTLGKWAVLDWLCANTDRHGANLMAGPSGQVKLIDHGGAFAGPSFDPAHDDSTFIPFYLRFRAPGFDALPTEEKLAVMPQLSAQQSLELQHWVQSIDAERLEAMLRKDGLNPDPVLYRLARLKALEPGSAYMVALNKLWIGA